MRTLAVTRIVGPAACREPDLIELGLGGLGLFGRRRGTEIGSGGLDGDGFSLGDDLDCGHYTFNRIGGSGIHFGLGDLGCHCIGCRCIGRGSGLGRLDGFSRRNGLGGRDGLGRCSTLRHRRSRHLGGAADAIAERVEDRSEVFAGSAEQRGHLDSDAEAVAFGSTGRQLALVGHRVERDQRPDDVGEALEDVDPHGTAAGDLEAGELIELHVHFGVDEE